MIFIKFFKVISLLTLLDLTSIIAVPSWSVHSSEELPLPSLEDAISESEISSVLNSLLERERVSLSVDQIESEVPDLVLLCDHEGYYYDPIAKRCSQPKTKAHCQDHMIFLPVPNVVGIGSCSCNNSDCWGRPQVLDEYYQCHAIGTQGLCNDEHVMVPVHKFHAECGHDACLYRSPENAVNFSEGSEKEPGAFPVFNFTYKGNCYTTESEGFCKRGQVMRFVFPYKIPACVDRNEKRCTTASLLYNLQSFASRPCADGYVRNPVRNICQPGGTSDFDF